MDSFDVVWWLHRRIRSIIGPICCENGQRHENNVEPIHCSFSDNLNGQNYILSQCCVQCKYNENISKYMFESIFLRFRVNYHNRLVGKISSITYKLRRTVFSASDPNVVHLNRTLSPNLTKFDIVCIMFWIDKKTNGIVLVIAPILLEKITVFRTKFTWRQKTYSFT